MTRTIALLLTLCSLAAATLQIHGTVLDADTNRPLPHFTVIQGIVFRDQPTTYWQRNEPTPNITTHPDGTFDLTQSATYPAYSIRIESDGYVPADSRPYTPDEQAVTLTFKLAKGHPLTGTIKRPDGSPAAGAQLVLATPNLPAYIENYTTIDPRGNSSTTTDANGRYTFPHQTTPFALAVIHDAGHADATSADLAKSPDLTLTPYAHIDGTLTIARAPAPDTDISVTPDATESDLFDLDPATPRFIHTIQTTTDPAGHFHIDRAPAGPLEISRVLLTSIDGTHFVQNPTHTTRALTRANETTHVTLGGTGRAIVGRLAIPPAVTSRPNWSFTHCALSSQNDLPKLPYPADFATLPFEAKKKWQSDFYHSDAGKTFKSTYTAAFAHHLENALPVNRDGSFRADDLPPGSYKFFFTIGQPTPAPIGKTLATTSLDVTVPTGPADAPIDVGTLPMTEPK